MSSRKGRVYNDSRFHDDYDTTIDQEFGRSQKLYDQASGFNRSSTTYYPETEGKVEGEEIYIRASPSRTVNMRTQSTPMTEGGLDKFTGMIKKEIKAHPPKYLGPEIRGDLIRAAELKLGTKISLPKSLYDFWNNHVKKRDMSMKDLYEKKIITMRPSSAKIAPIPEENKPKPEPKNPIVKELMAIYSKYENCRGMDVRLTLMQEHQKFKNQEEVMNKEKEIMMKKSKEVQKENAVLREINDYMKRYIDFKIRNNVIELDRKRTIITRIRDRHARSVSRSKSRSRNLSRSKSPSPKKARSQSSKRNNIHRSPIKLEGSLDDIEESKQESSIKEEKAAPPKEKLLKKLVRMTEEEKEFSEEEIKTFDYAKERREMEAKLRICQKVYAETLFQSRTSSCGFTNDPDQLLNVFRAKRTGQHTQELSKVFTKYSKTTENKNYLKEALDYLEAALGNFFRSEKDFMERVIVCYEKYEPPKQRSNDKILVFYKTMDDETLKKRCIHRKDGVQVIKTHVDQENEKVRKEQAKLEEEKKHKEGLVQRLAKLIAQDFSDPNVKAKPLDELAKPKDKWKRGKKLLELKSIFSHDLVLQRMIKDEFKENRIFKFPEEYEIYDDEEEFKRKMDKKKVVKAEERKAIQEDKEEKQKLAIDKFVVKENIRSEQIKMIEDNEKKTRKSFEAALKNEVIAYQEEAKNRLNKKREKGQKEIIADIYNRLHAQFPQLMDQLYPNPMYGIVKGSNAAKLAFPQQFKLDFYEKYRKLKRKGRAASTRPAYFVPPGVSHGSYNAKIKLGEEIMKKHEKPQPGVKTRVWKRDDYVEHLKDIMMTEDDALNCLFEPDAGSQNPYMKKILATFPELQREGYDQEKSLKEFVNKFGDKFAGSNPEIFKQGILKSAQAFYNKGEFNDAWRKLKEGFNIESLKKYFDPNYTKKQELKKKKLEERKKLIAEGKIKEDIKDNIEEPEEQRKMREEQFEKPKLLPILTEAYDLVKTMEERERKEKLEKNKVFQIIKVKALKHKEEVKKAKEEWTFKKTMKMKAKAEENKKREEEIKKKEEIEKKKAEQKKKEQEERLKQFKERNKISTKNLSKVKASSSKDRKHKEGEIY